MTLDIATVSYWYQDSASKLPVAPTKEARQLKPMIGIQQIHKWRHEWRKNNGNSPSLWGNE